MRDEEAGRRFKIMMKMGPKTKKTGTCQGHSSRGVDVAFVKAVDTNTALDVSRLLRGPSWYRSRLG